MKPQIELLLLDVDGVLLHYQRTRRVLHLACALQVPTEQVHQALYESGLEADYDAGIIDTPGYLKQLGDDLDAQVDPALWVAARMAASRAQASVIQRLLALPATLRLGLLTNNGPLMAEVIEQLLPDLHGRLQGRVLCSGMLGGRKPAPAVFLQALQHLQATPQRTLFVDDLFTNVRGARQAGLHAETVRDGRGLGRVLKRYRLG
ncbi:HAD-IA family hydrolase [Stenotrophomonas tumulicola]|uniref:HAD-IA family hydrolase n=1 Tax=Stenotrophomonas tumulicola TaxID=1685415 RepID=A0A7W3IIJ4_9GAMM|nr:HAD-IA family hydrolase [Stenotrophomonas tumulicola]MBA8681709.1 HAD-IA family hydrolase [Stenotrophomonas tumulicola]